MISFAGREHKKRIKGDTLVEVSLAIGIFSMVAIAAVSVINGSTTGAQASLESTITREEIDGQAEALRFIQSAYVAGGEIDESNPTKYASLWQTIANRAIDLSSLSSADRDLVLKYNPVSCDTLYDSSDSAGWGTLKRQHAFIINTRAMSSNDLSKIVVGYAPGTFRTAATYPRVIYNGVTSDALYDPDDSSSSFSITNAEGIYIIAVRDEDGTIIVSDSGDSTTVKSAYIDFYIRSCWFTPSADRASTISTAIRLYDPDAISINKYQRKGVLIRYGGNGASTGAMAQQYIFAGESGTILSNQFVWPGHRFKYWTTNADGTGTRYDPGNIYRVASNITTSSAVTLYAQWEVLQVNLAFNANGGTGTMNTQRIAAGTSQYITANAFTRTGYAFDHWSTKADGTGTNYNNGVRYEASPDILNEQTVNLYAQWRAVPYTLTYDANGGSYAPAAQSCYLSTIQKCYVTSSAPSRSGYKFLGWADSSSATSAKYSAGSEVTITGNKTLYAVWQTQNETITVKLSWSSSPKDLDSYVTGQKSDGTSFTAYYGNRVGSDVSGLTIASLDKDVTSGYGVETFTINTLGGRNYYYSVRNYSSDSSITNATVTVSGPYVGTPTYYASNATGSGRVWNVFAYKDGRIIYKGTRSSSADNSY